MKARILRINFLNIIFITSLYQLNWSQSISQSFETTQNRIIINLENKILDVYINDTLWKSYPVAVGKSDTPTPLGEFQIINKVINPTWYPQRKEPVEPGIHNPLGTRWMGLNEKGYGIHGTNDPHSIGKSISKGCIRMKKQDIEELFENMPVGTLVQIIENSLKEDEIVPVYADKIDLKQSTDQILGFKLLASHAVTKVY